MKIRSGFVSNSSSSSFIVAFPKKPKSQTDVLEMMFPNDPNGHVTSPWSHVETILTHQKASEQVFSNIQEQKKKVFKKDLLDVLNGRYYVNDGKLYYEGFSYCALDKKLAQQLIDAYDANENERKRFDKFEREFLKINLGNPVPHAYEDGINWKTKQPYINAEITAYTSYCKSEDKLKLESKEYISEKTKHDKLTRQFWDIQGELRKKLAEVDLAAFMKDNKGKFISKFTYSDNDGEFFSLMEHAGIFDNLNHITISHH